MSKQQLTKLSQPIIQAQADDNETSAAAKASFSLKSLVLYSYYFHLFFFIAFVDCQLI